MFRNNVDAVVSHAIKVIPETSILVLSIMFPNGVSAKSNCGTDKVVSPSAYNLRGSAEMNGARINSRGHVVGADGKEKGCEAANGLISAKGAGGCLIPFFSIAADLSVYRIGDIIYMPDVASAKLRFPPFQMKHPGFFIVQDTGGAWRNAGKGRFDFFTGAFTRKSPENPFGDSGEFRDLNDRHTCQTEKRKYYVIHRGQSTVIPGKGKVSYAQAKAAIRRATSVPDSRLKMASIEN